MRPDIARNLAVKYVSRYYDLKAKETKRFVRYVLRAVEWRFLGADRPKSFDSRAESDLTRMAESFLDYHRDELISEAEKLRAPTDVPE